MDSPAFPKSRDSKLLNDTGTREQFLIELLDMLKDHYEAAKSSRAYVMRTKIAEKLRQTISIIENIYDKYECEFGRSFSFYMQEVEAAHRISGPGAERTALSDATGEA